MKDRGYTAELVDRAAAAGCPVLMMTVDIPVGALRRRDPKNGLSVPPRLRLRSALDMLGKPGWLLALLRAKRRDFGNMAAAVKRAGDMPFSQFVQSQFDASVTWQDLERYRAQWQGKLIVKGIMDAEDARQAVALGADALVVSNHGGRQLDGAPSSISMLPAISRPCRAAPKCARQRRALGQDVLKARAWGEGRARRRAGCMASDALGEQACPGARYHRPEPSGEPRRSRSATTSTNGDPVTWCRGRARVTHRRPQAAWASTWSRLSPSQAVRADRCRASCTGDRRRFGHRPAVAIGFAGRATRCHRGPPQWQCWRQTAAAAGGQRYSVPTDVTMTRAGPRWWSATVGEYGRSNVRQQRWHPAPAMPTDERMPMPGAASSTPIHRRSSRTGGVRAMKAQERAAGASSITARSPL